MPPLDLITIVLQGGAVVVLLLWVFDLRAQRREERSERIANGVIMREVGASLGELTEAIEALIEDRSPRPSRSRR